MKSINLIILFFLCFITSIAQPSDTLLTHIILTKKFVKQEVVKYTPTLAKPLSDSSKVKVNPVHFVAAGMLYTYQVVFSEQIQADCIYHLSCSKYTKLCIEKFGLVKGTLQGFHQFSNCFEGVIYDYPDYKVNSIQKINNTIDLQ